MDYSMPGFPVLHCLPECTQTHVHWVNDAIQLSHSLSPPSPFAFNLSQHQRFVQRVSSLHHVAKVLELPLQHQSSQWIFRIDEYSLEGLMLGQFYPFPGWMQQPHNCPVPTTLTCATSSHSPPTFIQQSQTDQVSSCSNSGCSLLL